MVRQKLEFYEVKDFHPIVEHLLKEALKEASLGENYEVVHHFSDYRIGRPDFVILEKESGKIVCIIEVKKSSFMVEEIDSGYQCKKYVDKSFITKSGPKLWADGFFPNFCVTNIETTQLYFWRGNRASAECCKIKNSPFRMGKSYDGFCTKRFIYFFANYLKKIHIKAKPEFENQEITEEMVRQKQELVNRSAKLRLDQEQWLRENHITFSTMIRDHIDDLMRKNEANNKSSIKSQQEN
jgi:hypothetical protein